MALIVMGSGPWLVWLHRELGPMSLRRDDLLTALIDVLMTRNGPNLLHPDDLRLYFPLSHM